MSIEAYLFYGSVVCLLLSAGCLCAAKLKADDVAEREKVVSAILAAADSKLRQLREQTKHTATGISQ